MGGIQLEEIDRVEKNKNPQKNRQSKSKWKKAYTIPIILLGKEKEE